jgi:hypothetical protein
MFQGGVADFGDIPVGEQLALGFIWGQIEMVE